MRLEDLKKSELCTLDIMLMLKIKELRQNQLRAISKDNLIDYLFNVKWKKKDRFVVCEVVEDIFELNPSQVFDYLSNKGIRQAAYQTLDDFSDLFIN